MHRPSATEMLKENESYYSLVVGVAKRARQIAEEAEEKGEILSEKPVQLAVQELAQGQFKIKEASEDAVEEIVEEAPTEEEVVEEATEEEAIEEALEVFEEQILEDLAEAEEEDEELTAFVGNYQEKQRPAVMALLERHREKQIIIFRSRREASDWLFRRTQEMGEAARKK